MDHRTARTLAAAALALGLGACSDIPTTAPARVARAPGAPAHTVSSGVTLIPNSVKYRDNGGKPATGRSGSAELEALALMAKDGTATLAARARSIDPAVDDTGQVSKLQIKALSPNGALKFTRNLNGQSGAEPLQIQGLARGDQVQLQANVRGLDGSRTDVVTVTERVKLLPDLRVELSAPGETAPNRFVNIMAVVQERNGDVGTYAECQLRVDGMLVDYAPRVWVDAGDAVTCAFAWFFTTPGIHQLEVRAATAGGAEWDDADNAATGTIQVREETLEFSTHAYFRQTTSVDSGHYESRWRWGLDGIVGENVDDYFRASTDQRGGMYGHMRAAITDPVGVRVRMSTGDRVVHEAEWEDSHPYRYDYWCTSQWLNGAGFFLCSNAFNQMTSFDYSFMAGAVTYHSQGFYRTWDERTGEDLWVYHWNQNEAWDETIPLGEDWTFDVRITTPGREHVLHRALRLVRSEPWEYSRPYECRTHEEPYWDYTQTICEAWNLRFESVDGV